MSAPGPNLPPRPRPAYGKQSSASTPGASGRAPAPPVPAPRGSKVSALAESFRSSTTNRPPSPPSARTVTPPTTKAATPPPVPVSARPPAPLSPLNHVDSPGTPPPGLPSRRKISEAKSSPPTPARQQTAMPSINSEAEGEGFGVCLQNCYDTINRRHEDELLALESFRNHIFARARLDKDYSENMNKMNMKASRKMNSVTNKTSAILQAWMCFMELSENLQRHLSNGAAQMSSVLLHSVDQLIRDKRGAKTAFDQERARMDSECTLSCKTAQELRRSYLSFAKLTAVNKKKLEAALEKDPPRLADQEKYRKKFVQNAEKLHTCHNDYSLSISNANIHIDHHRKTLLPFCLDTLQQRMELQISQWKDAMMNYALALDLTKVYEEQFTQLYSSLRQVEQDQEYVQFIRENKKDQAPLEYYEFDTSLLVEPCAPQVDAGQIVINNLTYQGMKMRLGMLDSEIEQHSQDMDKMKSDLNELIGNVEESMGASPTSPSKEGQQKLPKHVRVATLNAGTRELDCMIARKQEQASVIRAVVDSTNEEDVPLFHELGEGVDPKDLDMSQALSGSVTLTTKKRGMSLSGGLSTLSRFGKGFRKIGGKFGRIGSSSLSTTSEEATPTSPSMSFSEEGEGQDDSDNEASYDQPPELPVEEEEWYYGDIDRRVAESKCKNVGDYIVRYSERQAKFVLTCNWNGHGKHFVITQLTDESGGKLFRFEAKSFATIRALLDYHVETVTAVTKASQATIQRPVPKHDKWSIAHSNVKIGRKLGKGAFGDVFEAHLDGQIVAVKTCRSSDVTDMDKFMMEADILKQYDHPNVVRLMGVCADEEPVYLVMEFMPGGALLEFLRKKGSHQTKKKLCLMIVDAASGMAYLESQHCIHRDLAARNCLVGDNDSIKISDFGMSREDENNTYTVSSGTRQIPIKWTAPEALNYGKYSSASDVWSFGILLWEVYSCGSAPYPGMSNHDARSQIEVGYRMPAPTDTPEVVNGVMQQCWQYDPEERPDFKTLLGMLTDAASKVKN